MSWRETTPQSERLLLVQRAQEGQSVSRLAREFGISRKTAYKWIERFEQQAEAGLTDQSRRPLKSPRALSEETVQAVLALRQQYPFWGARKLHALLVRQFGVAAPSQTSVRRLLLRHGLLHENTRRRRPP